MSYLPESPKPVVIKDIQMSFMSMVIFIVKWTIASIPALIILSIIMAVLSVIFGGMIAGLLNFF